MFTILSTISQAGIHLSYTTITDVNLSGYVYILAAVQVSWEINNLHEKSNFANNRAEDECWLVSIMVLILCRYLAYSQLKTCGRDWESSEEESHRTSAQDIAHWPPYAVSQTSLLHWQYLHTTSGDKLVPERGSQSHSYHEDRPQAE